jgi:hypothetical protein
MNRIKCTRPCMHLRMCTHVSMNVCMVVLIYSFTCFIYYLFVFLFIYLFICFHLLFIHYLFVYLFVYLLFIYLVVRLLICYVFI